MKNAALLECLSLFERNPYMIDTAEGIAMRLGRAGKDTDILIQQLVEAESLVLVAQAGSKLLYQYQMNEQTSIASSASEQAFRDKYEAGFNKLSTRERSVLELLILGQSNRSIAETLCISVHTVKNHVTNILTKMGFPDRHQLLAAAYQVLIEK